MLSESESLSELISHLSIKAVSCKIETSKGNVSEGSKLESTSPSSAAEVAENMMTLRSSEFDESLNVVLPRSILPVVTALRRAAPKALVLSRLVSFHPSSSLYRPFETPTAM